jgi:hypothetical protein
VSPGTYRNGCASVGWLVVERRKPPRAVQGFRGTEGGPYPRMLDTGCDYAAVRRTPYFVEAVAGRSLASG